MHLMFNYIKIMIPVITTWGKKIDVFLVFSNWVEKIFCYKIQIKLL